MSCAFSTVSPSQHFLLYNDSLRKSQTNLRKSQTNDRRSDTTAPAHGASMTKHTVQAGANAWPCMIALAWPGLHMAQHGFE